MSIEIQNLESGITYDEFICPREIVVEAERAINRGQTSGLIYGDGDRWAWRAVPEDAVTLEFTRGDKVVHRFDIEKMCWDAFRLVAARNGCEAKDYLAACLAHCLEDGDSLAEAVGWLFSISPTRSEEITRFEQAQREFHGGGVS